ncbi:Do family serine endopeptidase [Jiella sp. MQZ9-1]|uniref:Probable periplasmic serine endoprotease DegP-like n=1 Tax=Jiella flava TaxID=2816857 RepID=A0A939FX16_9HYPH|nr:DegQ family serine endoprotease [Jiella flava]MBO0661735.1 Do family serine endopeptidase [Jiella flava]MCD2470376.1 Do family serine endopeptidase [Jiella flava]
MAMRAPILLPVLFAALLAGAAPLRHAEAQTPQLGGKPAPATPKLPTAPSPAQPPSPEGEAKKPQAGAPEETVPALPVPPVEGKSGGASEASPKALPGTAPGAAASAPTPMRYGPASVADLADKLLPAVVNVSTAQGVKQPGRGVPQLQAPEGSPLQDFFDDLLRDKNGAGERSVQSLGSGFVIDPSGVIITNNHVIGDADTITVNFANGDQFDAKLIGKDPKTDLAVLKIDAGKPLPFVKFGDSEKLRIGDWVMAIGNPFGLGGSVSMGIVSARGRNINAGPYDNFIQTDAAINRGNSGGPLFDMEGDVVGINTAIISPTGGSIGIGFSIPANLAVNVIDQLREYGETRRGWLGIRLQALNEEIARGLGIDKEHGAVVMGVVPGGPSDNGSLKVGDVIVSFEGRKVEGSSDLPRMVAETKVGTTVKLGILRKTSRSEPAKPLTVEIKLGRLEDGEKTMAAAEKPGGDTSRANKPGGTKPGDKSATPSSAGTIETLGMTITNIDAAKRKSFELPDDANGALITAVDPNSDAAEKGVEAGMRITEVAQETVANASEVKAKIDTLKQDGRRNALLLLTAKNGDVRFVVVPIE